MDELRNAAKYDSGEEFLSIADIVISPGNESLYQRMAEVAATTGNLSVIKAIETRYLLNFNTIATIARSHGHWGVAGWITGYDHVVPKYDAPSTEDLEEERELLAESWQNSGGWTLIHNDQPIEVYDDTPQRKILGTREWSMSDGKVPFTSPNVEYDDLP